MICPSCRLYISDPDTSICPRCGQPQFDTDRAQDYEQRPPESPYRPSGASFPRYGSQPYEDQPYSGQRYSGPAHRQEYGGQWPQPGFSQAVGPVPAMPSRKTSRARRIFLYGGLSVGLIAFGAALCLGGLIFLGLQQQANLKKSVATATPFPGTAAGATILFQDALTSNINSWPEESHCSFHDNAYHIKNNFACFAPAGNFGDENITVQAKQVAGSLRYAYGIVFRRTNKSNWYEFDIDGNSEWVFIKVVNEKVSMLVHFTLNAAIKGGLNTTNTLRVQAKGAHFEFYINGTKVGKADDTTFSSGKSGLVANGDGTEVAYNNFQITGAS
ncbi:MAG TPA: hypothetical protein VH599_19690 [Ktedonobacterales bacterium]|jgi:hypothetical protein